MLGFNQFKLSKELHNSIKDLGYDNPTKIQQATIPIILQGRDMLGESETGSGKTLAFGTGVVENTVKGKGIQALILTPTRELAEQVKNALKKLAAHKKLKVIAIYGGVDIEKQFRELDRAEIVVATPGRFLDHMQRRSVNTRNVKTLVLDEADRMLDMGFIDDIEKIIRACSNRKQTLFFSATIPAEIDKLSRKYLKSPVKVSTSQQVDPKKLKQVYYDVPRSLKLSLLIHLIKHNSNKKAMVFSNTRRGVDIISKKLTSAKINATAIHGGFQQSKRIKAITAFKRHEANVLVCTDVAARGIHVDNIEIIYNYDIPSNPVDYVHRIGRTARAGKQGVAINLLSPQDHDNFRRLLYHYRFDINKQKRPYVERIDSKK